MYIDDINLIMTNTYEMHVKKHYFDLLRDEVKTVEFRLNDKKRKKMKTGDKIRFICQNDCNTSIVLSISYIIKSSTFSSLIKKVEPHSLGGLSLQDQLIELEEIYDKASENKYGVLALILERK